MSQPRDTGRDPSPEEYERAQRIVRMPPAEQRKQACAVRADLNKLSHINTYGERPEFYVDQPFECRQCGKREIWRAADQKWYYEEAKGHIDALAVECHDCRKARKRGGRPE